MKEKLIALVNSTGPIKSTELVARPEFLEIGCDPGLIYELVAEGSLGELEYIVPEMNYRVKSLIFPMGTRVNVRNMDAI